MEDNILYVDFVQKKRVAKPDIALPQISHANLERYRHFSNCLGLGIVATIINGSHLSVKLPENAKISGVKVTWSRKFNIPDFAMDDQGVRGVLEFGGKPFFVDIPWNQVYAIFAVADQNETMREWQVET